MRQRLFKSIILIGSLWLVAACSGSDEASGYDKELVREFMLNELDPATDGIWDHAGYILTDEGEEELWPTTDEGWQEVVDSADKVAALAKQLQEDEFSKGDENWIAIAQGLVRAAERAREAALEQEKQELFDAGGQIYRVCLSCHQAFIVEDGDNAE